jgi:hypothetical protein
LITCDFGSKAVDLKIKDFKGKNWRFKMEPLFDLLDPEKCKVNIKSNSISIVLEKQEPKKWTNLKYVKPISKPLAPATPSGGNEELMGLMKDLYKMGGNDMKQTITEAF